MPDLPIDESLYRTLPVYEHLAKAKEALGRLQGRSIALPDQGLLVNSITLQEAKDSSAIENIFTTDDELYKAYSEVKSQEVSGPAKEVLRYREALWDGHAYLRQKKAFDLEYILRIFQEVKQSREKLRPSFSEVVIRQGGSGPNAGKVVYTPPRGKGILEAKLQNLLEFINDDERFTIDPLLKMAIAHFQFEAIHPFRDGNGRTGRILNIHLLTQKQLLDYPILYLSRYIMRNKEEYYAALAGVSQHGNWQAWLLYMLKAVEHTAQLTYVKINRIITARDAIFNEIKGEFQRPEQLVRALFTQPYTKVLHLSGPGNFSENTARNYLNKMVEMGILEKKVINGHHYYLNLELYYILAD